jgi:hypothetical protein
MPLSSRTALCASRWTLVALALIAPAGAGAVSPPTVALHQTEVVDERSDRAELMHALVATALVRQGAALAPSEQVQRFLQSREGGCMTLPDAQRAACLSALASAVGARRALAVTIAPFVPGRILLGALVVGADGEILQTLAAVEFPRPPAVPIERALEAALAEFVPRLDIFQDLSFQLAPLAQAAQPATAVVELPVAAPVGQGPQMKPGARRRPHAYASLAAGAVLLGAGAYGLGHSGRQLAEFEQAYAQEGRPLPSEAQRLADLRASAGRSRLLGGAGLGLGAAAVGTGLYLLVASDSPIVVGPTSVGVAFTFQ